MTSETLYIDDDGVISREEYERRMMQMSPYTSRTGQRLILMSEPLFEEFIALLRETKGLEIEVDYGSAITGTHTYYEPTIYERDPHPDPLTVPKVDGG